MRLPSKAESRFQVYCSLIKGGQDVMFFAYVFLLEAPATTGPYLRNDQPGNGIQWSEDVAKPIMEELNLYAFAIDNKAISNAVSGWTDSVIGNLYRDPASGRCYLLTVNYTPDTKTAVLTINIPGAWTKLRPYGGDGNTDITITGNKVTLDYTKYQVRNFEVVH